MPTARVWLTSFAGSWALWLVLAGSVVRSEVVAGAAVAVLAAGVTVAVFRRRADRSAVATAQLKLVGASLLAVPGDVVRLAAALARAAAGRSVPGGFAEVPVEDDGGRAFAAAAESLSPGTYVVEAEHGERAMLVHRVGRERRR